MYIHVLVLGSWVCQSPLGICWLDIMKLRHFNCCVGEACFGGAVFIPPCMTAGRASNFYHVFDEDGTWTWARACLLALWGSAEFCYSVATTYTKESKGPLPHEGSKARLLEVREADRQRAQLCRVMIYIRHMRGRAFYHALCVYLQVCMYMYMYILHLCDLCGSKSPWGVCVGLDWHND